MLGVRYLRLREVVSRQNGTEVSCQPMSSTRKRMIFGWEKEVSAEALFLGVAAELAQTAAKKMKQ